MALTHKFAAVSGHTRPVIDWGAVLEREETRYRDGEARLPDDADAHQRQLTRMGNAAYGAGLALLMRGDDARDWLVRAADRWRESYAGAPPGSWGRPVGAIKARVLAGDWDGATDDARWALEEGAAEAESPIGRYAAALAAAVLDDRRQLRFLADGLRTGSEFPADVGDALAFLAADDVTGFVDAVESVLASFESRDEYLEDVPVADTVLVLQALAARRGMAAELGSPLLPG